MQPVKSASAPAQNRTALPSGSPAEHLAVCALLKKRRKFAKENFSKDERKDKGVATKSQKKVKKVTQGGKQK